MMIREGLLILEEADYDKIREKTTGRKHRLIDVVKEELKLHGIKIFQIQNMSINRDPRYIQLSMKVSKVLQQEVLKERNKKMRYR